METPEELERRGGGAVDPEALLALGTRRMVEAESFESFSAGAALVEQSAALGHPDAMCFLATMEAVGAGRPRDWNKAFDGLALAAARGSGPARSQLRLLAGGETGEGETDWASLRGRIDPERLFRVGFPEVLAERPRLQVFRGFAEPAECEWVIARMRPKLGPAMVWDEAAGGGRLDPSRSNSAVELRLTEMDVVTAALRARISAATRLPEPIFEVPQVMHYAVGQQFTPHHDFLDPAQPGHAADLALRGQRIGTFLLYLNDGFEGGETEFPDAGLNFRGGAGDALFFANVTPDGRPDPLTRHAGRPPSKGEKWIFSQWIRDRVPGRAGAGAA